MIAAGCAWFECRTAAAAMAAIASCGLRFREIVNGSGERESYQHPTLAPFEHWRTDPTDKRPAHPLVTIARGEAKRRYRLRKEMRAREAAKLAPERNDDAGDDIASTESLAGLIPADDGASP
jgi:hypothetical protein